MIRKYIASLFKKDNAPTGNIGVNTMLLRNGIEATFNDLTLTPLMYLDALDHVLDNKDNYPPDVVSTAFGINRQDVLHHLDEYEKHTSNCCSGGYTRRK